MMMFLHTYSNKHLACSSEAGFIVSQGVTDWVEKVHSSYMLRPCLSANNITVMLLALKWPQYQCT